MLRGQGRASLARVPVWLRWLVAALACVELLLFGYGRAQAALYHARAARQLFRGDLATAAAACGELKAGLGEAGPLVPLAGAARLIPVGRLRAVGAVPDLASASEHACRGLEEALTVMPHDAQAGDAGALLLAALEGRQETLLQVRDELRAALLALDRVNPDDLAADSELAMLAPVVQQAQVRSRDAEAATQLIPALPHLFARLLGGDRARTYLLVGQNNDEARATGGFLGTLGLVTLQNGRLVKADVRSSYLWDQPEVPKLPAPEPLARYMNFGGWYLRDANWWIDFRRTAEQLLLLWDREQGGADHIDGVIAMDRDALQRVLGAMGGVDVAELGGRVDADNLGPILDQRRRSGEARQSYADYQRVKTEALGAIHSALVRKLLQLRGSEYLGVASAFASAAADGHLLLWFRDPELEATAGYLGWDGRLDTGAGDFLGVVDTSMSYGKVGPYIARTTDRQRQADGTTVLTLTYRNHYAPSRGAVWDPLVDGTWWDWRERVFRREQGAWLGYVRVLAPAGAHLLDASGWDDVPSLTSEGPAAVFGAPVLVRPGETRTLRLVYANPAPAAAPLKLFRQPGDPNR